MLFVSANQLEIKSYFWYLLSLNTPSNISKAFDKGFKSGVFNSLIGLELVKTKILRSAKSFLFLKDFKLVEAEI
jgi:hypothetical protein